MCQTISHLGEVKDVTPNNDKFVMEELQEYVDGTFALYPMHGQADASGEPILDMVMVVDEDGWDNNKKANHEASMKIGFTIVGDVLITRRGMID